MKPSNADPPGSKALRATRGTASTNLAGAKGMVWRDGTTESSGQIRDMTVVGLTFTDNDDGTGILSAGGSTGTGTPNWGNVIDFGATGDGVTDDTSAIQAAVASVCAVGGGIVYYPVGTYLISATLTVTCDNVTFQGDGQLASVILAAPAMAASNVIDVTGAAFSMRDMAVTSTSIKSGGVGLYLNGSNDVSIERIYFSHMYDTLKINNTTIVRLNDLSLRDQSRHGLWITGSANDYYLSQIVADNSVTASGNGLYIDGGAQAVIAENCDFIHFTNGLLMQPSATSTWHFFTGMIFDTNANDGIHLGDGAAQLRGTTFVNCWAASNTNTGVYFGANVEGVQFLGGKVLNNGQHGFSVDSTTATRTTISDNLIVSNSQASSGTYSGIRVKAGVTHLTITGNHSYNGLSLGSTQKYGLTLDSGATDYLVIDGNNFAGNATGEINDLATGTHRWRGGSASDTGWSATTFWRGDGTWATPATSFAVPAIDYGTPSAGVATTAIRTDAVLAAPLAADIAITDAGGYYTGTDVDDALQEAGAAVVAAQGLLTVDAGTPSYNVAGADVVTTITSKWGYDASGPYFNDAGVTSGDEAILAMDPTDGEFVVIPYAP